AIYRPIACTPTAQQHDLIRQFAHIASIAIEQTKSDRAVRRSEAFLAAGEAISETGTFLWRPDTGETRWADQLRRLFEFEPGPSVAIDQAIARVHPEDRALLQDAIRRAQAEFDSDFEFRLQMPDARVKHLHFRGRAGHGLDGRIEYVGAAQDITARKLADLALDK